MVKEFLAQLPHAKRASEAPWVRKFGNPSSQENLVVTSPYEQTSFLRPSVHTDYGGGEGSLAVILMGIRRIPSFLNKILKEKENSFQLVANKR